MDWLYFCIFVGVDLLLIAGLVVRNVELADQAKYWRSRCMSPRQHLN